MFHEKPSYETEHMNDKREMEGNKLDPIYVFYCRQNTLLYFENEFYSIDWLFIYSSTFGCDSVIALEYNLFCKSILMAHRSRLLSCLWPNTSLNAYKCDSSGWIFPSSLVHWRGSKLTKLAVWVRQGKKLLPPPSGSSTFHWTKNNDFHEWPLNDSGLIGFDVKTSRWVLGPWEMRGSWKYSVAWYQPLLVITK